MSTAPVQTLRTSSGAAVAHAVREPAAPAGQPDPQLVSDTKNEIRQLVQEIAGLAQGDLAPLEFYTAFLNRVVSAMAAAGGAVWTPGDGGRLAAEYQINLAQCGVEASAESRQSHGVLLKQTLAGKQALLVPPQSAGSGGERTGNPTDYLLVLVPLVVEKEPLAVVEIFQRPGGGPTTQRGYLRFLVQMCDLACEYLRNQRLRRLAGDQQLWRQIDQFVQAIHRSLDLTATSFAVVNEGRRLIQCDRVSLALSYGGRCRIEAISGLDTIERRSAEVKRLAALATAVLRTGEPFWQGVSESPPQIAEPLEAYVDQSHARMVAVLPLVPREDESSATSSGSARPIGAIIIEQMRDARATDALQTRAEIVAQHSARALVNAIGHSSLFLLPLWQALGKATWLLRGRTLPKTLLAAALVAGTIAALAGIQTDFEVAARGKLQPAERREVFAQLDGVVVEVPVRHGQFVQPGAVLARLTNTNLELELAELIGRQTTNQEQLAAHQRALLDNTHRSGARLSPIDENRLASEMLQLKQEAENLQRELALIQEKQRQLTVVAVYGGQVVTWKVEDLLLGRPVVRGQSLLTLANPDGPWELELYVPERRLKHLQAAGASDPVSAMPFDRPALDVTFTLSSHPGEEFHGRVVEFEEVAEVRGEEGNTVLARVEIDRSTLPPLHDQTTVTAKLDCGRTSVGYAWFCDLIETVQTKVLFWLPS